MTTSHRTLMTTCVVAALSCTGCSTPPVQYFRGPPVPTEARSSLPQALMYLENARDQYRKAVETQMQDERNLTNALVGGGALMAALALGNVHRDTITGAALLAGTGYTLGNVNLQRPRVLVYLAGVESLSCAEKAIAPLDIAGTNTTGLKAALERLEASRTLLKGAIGRGKALLPTVLSSSEESKYLGSALRSGMQVLQASDDTLKSGRNLLAEGARAARELVAAVNGIDGAIVRSLVSATPELSVVPSLIAGLAQISGAFVPGAGIDTLMGDRLKATLDTPKSGVAVDSPLIVAADAILTAATETAASDAEVRRHIPSQATAWPADAFKNCGVAEVISPLTSSVSSLQFTAGVDDRQVFEIYGGVKPYFVRIDGPTVDGLLAKSPVRFDNQAEVSVVGSKLTNPLEARVRVLDSSPTARTLNVPLVVSAPPGKPVAASGSNGDNASVATLAVDADLNKLKQKGQFKLGGKSFGLLGIPVKNGDALEVTILCPPGDNRAHPRADLAQALLDAAGIVEPPKRNLRIKTQPATCMSG